MILLSLQELARARPHMHKTARFSTAEYRAYCEGYYFGVVYALRVAVAAIDRYRLATRERRKAAKHKASA